VIRAGGNSIAVCLATAWLTSIAPSASAQDDNQVGPFKRAAMQCVQLGDMSACDELVSAHPNNAQAFVVKGNALLRANRVDEAIAAYTRASQLAPNNLLVASKLQVAQSQRQLLQQRCMSGDGDGALQACQAILTKGAGDEFDTTVRIAQLQRSGNQPAPALNSYIAANLLRPTDKSVALAIVSLVDITQRKDASALAARGSALITLGRASEAVTSLRAAYALAPQPELARQVASAEALVKQQERSHPGGRSAVPLADKGALAPAPRTSFSNLEAASRSN
jgi:tetratricopeptide (TPR) repeat protein